MKDIRYKENNYQFHYRTSAIIYNKDKTKSYHISLLFVANEERGKGISTSLLEVHENFAKNNNFDEINLSVLGNNLNAKNIYIKKHKYQIERTLFVFNAL